MGLQIMGGEKKYGFCGKKKTSAVIIRLSSYGKSNTALTSSQK